MGATWTQRQKFRRQRFKATLFWAVQRLRRNMRTDWILTRIETLFLFTGVVLMAAGVVWVTL
jgi:hypothetical protein